MASPHPSAHSSAGLRRRSIAFSSAPPEPAGRSADESRPAGAAAITGGRDVALDLVPVANRGAYTHSTLRALEFSATEFLRVFAGLAERVRSRQ